jgi:anaerobic selenocysteine-containing dehydrogenase
MTNNWPDIGNATLVVAMGANPAENHPACMAHINNARKGPHTWYDGAGNAVTVAKAAAKLIVIDPRYTRTASQADSYVRIRPGTDIAFINGLIKYITDSGGMSVQQRTNFLAYLNQTQGQAYIGDVNISTMVLNSTRYTDARITVNSGRTDYLRTTMGAFTVGATDLATNVTRPSIVLDGTTLKMWFVPKTGSDFIQYSASTDNGATWSAPVDTNINFVTTGADSPRVFKEGTVWYMANTDGTDITLSVASDLAGLIWGGSSTLLTSASFEAGALTKIDAPMLLKDGTASWKLYVQGTRTLDWKRRVYLASTTTMTPSTWTGTSFAVASSGVAVVGVGAASSFDEDYVMHPFVWKDGASYSMTYTGRNAGGTTVFNLGGAQSADGVAWTKTVQLAGFPVDATKANVVQIGTAFYQFFTMDGSYTLRSGTANAAAPISNFPVFASTCTAADTVYSVLRQHVAPYTLDVVANICGCSQTEIELVAQAFIDNSQCSSYNPASPASTIWEPKNQYYRATTMLYAMGLTQHTHGAQNVKSFAVLQTLLGNMGRCGGGINALRGIHNVQGSTDMGLLYGNTVGYNFSQPTDVTAVDPNGFGKYLDKLFGNRLSGPTSTYDHAYVRTRMGLQQRGWYNQLLAWFGPGVSGRADVNKVWDLYPKGNGDTHIRMFRKMATGDTKAAVVWGMNPAVTEPNQSKVRTGLEALDLLVVTDNYATETAQCHRKDNSRTYLLPACSYVEEAGSVANSGRVLQWREKATAPKGNSKADLELLLRFAKVLNDHGAFSHIKAQWDSFPVSHHLYNKDVYDVLYRDRYGWSPSDTAKFEEVSLTGVDIWRGENATATGPFSSNVVTGSEAVTERIYREMSGPQNMGGTVWLYLEGYDDGYRALEWDPADTTTAFTYQAAGTDTVPLSVSVTSIAGVAFFEGTDYTVVYSTASPSVAGTVLAVSVGLIAAGPVFVKFQVAASASTGRGRDWTVYNRAKSRSNADIDPSTAVVAGTTVSHGHRMYKNWGYSWLVNRRVLYSSTTDLPWDQTDAFQGPERCSRMFTAINTGTIDYATSYRHVHGLADKPDVVLAGSLNAASPHFLPSGVSLAGRFPGHTEPYETPNTGLAATWGRNTNNASTWTWPATQVKWNLVPSDTAVYAPDDVGGGRTGTVPTEITDAATSKGLPDIAAPLVLTTIRCVEHFQGGPITRNNSYNVEAEPVPWVEINSIDARLRGIADGDWVNVVTVRSNSTTDQTAVGRMGTRYVAQPGNPADNFGKGFRARVGVGLAPNQRVGAGVVAIPWHWGDQGLSTGARANDLCIDAMDANTTIPEYKACICWITKA